MSTVIETKGLTKIYQSGEEELRALDNIDFLVEENEYLAVLGPSGSGKSTLMHILGCLDQPTSGSYFLAGEEVTKLPGEYMAELRNKKIGFVFQKFNLLPRLSALENVILPLYYRGIEQEEAQKIAEEKLIMLGLSNRMHHRPNELSGGQQQRVAVARALVGNPPLILADEPTGNLDSKSSQDVMNIFSELHMQGHTILIITHDREVAENVKRVVYIKDGKLTTSL